MQGQSGILRSHRLKTPFARHNPRPHLRRHILLGGLVELGRSERDLQAGHCGGGRVGSAVVLRSSALAAVLGLRLVAVLSSLLGSGLAHLLLDGGLGGSSGGGETAAVGSGGRTFRLGTAHTLGSLGDLSQSGNRAVVTVAAVGFSALLLVGLDGFRGWGGE